ncbi:MAG: alginate lyase family protein, partial [Thermoleophilaceae bacterium]
MSLARLRRMSTAEIVFRGRQEAFKWLERSPLARRNGHLPAAGALDRERFFPGPTDPASAELVRERDPAAAAAVVAWAARARAGSFDLLGYEGLSFGDPLDWQLDPVSGVRAPLVHWSRLDVLDRGQVGDSKVQWELGRHQWLVAFGQAYRLTGDESWCEAFVRSVRGWAAANPRGRGIQWASSLEVALRLISWLWALALFGAALPPGFEAELLAMVGEHAAHVERYLSRYFAANTHLTGEALGLLYAGLLLPDSRHGARWTERGMGILAEQAERQILDDGVYFEQSTCYQRYTAEIYLHALILAARSGSAFPESVAERVQRLLDFLLWTAHPQGSMPMLGDADGGWLLPLARRASDDLRGLFSTAAAWFGRADYAKAAGGRVAPETLWLLGRDGLERFDRLAPADPPGDPSRLFPKGGHVVMRDSWRPEAHRLLFDVAPLGDFGHAHADLLAIELAAFGHPYVVDPGTFCYGASAAWRDHFRGTEAHSTITVDGLGQATPGGLFRWHGRPAVTLRRWEPSVAFDFADAEHDGYARLADPVLHRRRVLFVKPRYWVIVDDVVGRAEHLIEHRLQFADLPVSVEGDWTRVEGPGGHGLLVRVFAAEPLERQLGSGELSPDYGRRLPAPLLVHSARRRLPLRLVTLLLPLEDASVPAPRVSASVDALVFEESGERIE